eukprot:UN24530
MADASRFEELSADLAANRRELSAKTKKLVELQNIIDEKDKEIDELRINNKLESQQNVDAIYLQLEEYKNQLHSRDVERQQLINRNMDLQRSFDSIKSQYDQMTFKYQQNDNEHKIRFAQLDLASKQQIDAMTKLHANQIKQYQYKIDAMQYEQRVTSTKETEEIEKALTELKHTHDEIEA